MDNQFCLKCGTQMDWKLLEGRQREVCPSCGWIHYEQLKVAAAARIELMGQLLLLQRAEEPWKGYWNLPAGFVEVDEAPDVAADREALEETNLETLSVIIAGEYYYDDDPRGNGVLLVYRSKVLTGRLKINQESTKAKYFAPDKLPENICGAGHRQAVEEWKMEKLAQ